MKNPFVVFQEKVLINKHKKTQSPSSYSKNLEVLITLEESLRRYANEPFSSDRSVILLKKTAKCQFYQIFSEFPTLLAFHKAMDKYCHNGHS